MSVNMIDSVTVAACVRRLESYEIDEMPVVRSRAFAASEIVVEEPSKGAVVGEGILSFTGNLSPALSRISNFLTNIKAKSGITNLSK